MYLKTLFPRKKDLLFIERVIPNFDTDEENSSAKYLVVIVT